MSLLEWWRRGWKMWEPNRKLYAEMQRLEDDLRAAQKRDPRLSLAVPDWLRRIREEDMAADLRLVRICRRQRILMLATPAMALLAIALAASCLMGG